LSTVTKDMLMFDYHGTFFLSSGGTIIEKEWPLTAIDIKKAVLKLSVKDVPTYLTWEGGITVDYYDWTTLSWKELGTAKAKGTVRSGYAEYDVTEILRKNPKFRWRLRVWVPWCLYYSCMQATGVLTLTYTPLTGEAEGTGYTGEFRFGEEMAGIAGLMNFMMQFMMMFMMMSLIMSMVGAISSS